MNKKHQNNPELFVSEWINSQPVTLESLRGRIVVLHFFQMLCPGCVTHGLPQATAVQSLYPESLVKVIGIHSVFEHHEVMTPNALSAFLQEYRISFPVAVDQSNADHPIPKTMDAFKLQGTPSLVILDSTGRIRLNHFGRLSDMQVGAFLGELIGELSSGTQTIEPVAAGKKEQETGEGCSSDSCPV